MNISPLKQINDNFGGKKKLAEEVEKLGKSLDAEALDGTRDGVKYISSKKLLRLHRVFSEVSSEFGSKTKLAQALADAEGRGKDKDYVESSLMSLPIPELFGRYQAKAAKTK